MKKSLCFLMCLAAVGMLAGCGSSGETATDAQTSGSSAAAEEGKPVVINYYDWDIPDQKFIDDFNAQNPDIKVVAHSIPANGERLTKLDILAMSGGDMDVMPISDGDQFTRFESGMLAPLDEYIERDGLDMEASFGKYAIWGQSDGVYYGIMFILYLTGVFVPSLLGICLMFGIGMALDFVPTMVLYIRMLKKENLKIDFRLDTNT